jgi:hypothetical protein
MGPTRHADPEPGRAPRGAVLRAVHAGQRRLQPVLEANGVVREPIAGPTCAALGRSPVNLQAQPSSRPL